ncbi:hypothetical protein PIB30_101229, partial [Stylosanthes scabra]|nr:hypothetical protein [Stylosanthes scabra]
ICKSWALVYLTEPRQNQVVTWVWRGVGLGSTLNSRSSMRMVRSGVLVTLSPRLYLVVARSGALFVALDPCPYLVKARSWRGSVLSKHCFSVFFFFLCFFFCFLQFPAYDLTNTQLSN